MDIDSGDELDDYGRTTPGPVRSQDGNPVAGPSKLAAKVANSKKPAAKSQAKQATASNSSDIEELHGMNQPFHATLDHEVGLIQVNGATTKSKAKDTRVVARKTVGGHRAVNKSVQPGSDNEIQINGKPTAPARKTVTNSREGSSQQHSTGAKRTQAVSDVVSVNDSSDRIDVEDDEPPPRGKTSGKGKATSDPDLTARRITKLETELERTKKKLEDTALQRDEFQNQLKENFDIRITQPEQLLHDQAQQYEARIQTQATLIEQLTSQLARVEPLARSGKNSILNLITREAADEEKRSLEMKLARSIEEREAKDRSLQERDRQIADIMQAENDLRLELKHEIEQHKALANKSSRNPPSSASRGAPSSVIDSPQHTAVIKLYEDFTNLLIPSVKMYPSEICLEDEIMFTCLCSSPKPDVHESLTFKLRFYHEKMEDSGDLIEMARYIPTDLDKETPEFVSRLEFLSEEFAFQRPQLPIFLTTLKDKLEQGSEPEDDPMDEQ